MRGSEKFIDKISLSIFDLQIDYLNFYNSVRNTEREFLINKGAVTVKVHTQLISALSNKERKKGYKKPSFNPRNSNYKRNEYKG